MTRAERSGLDASSLWLGFRLLLGLPGYLRRPLRLEEAHAVLRDRFQRRESLFLASMKRSVYGHRASPYREMLRAIGCEYGDVESLVQEKGVEETLRVLFRKGVYLSVEEFKGRRPAIRAGRAIEVGADRIRNPRAAFHVVAATGGSRSNEGTPVLFDLQFIRGCAANCSLYLDARGGREWLKSTWEVPGAGARFRLVKFASFGAPPVRWFSQLDPAAPNLHPIYRWSMRAMRWGSLLAGMPIPSAVHAPLKDPRPVAHWLSDSLRAGSTPHLFTFPSSAVVLCETAVERGIDIAGARFTISGEPITAARLSSVRKAGAEAVARYGSVECGAIGYGCLCPEELDEVHLQSDMHALIQAGEDGRDAGLPPQALLITSLHPRSPFTFLNTSMGDQAVLTKRDCCCPLQSLGWSWHLHSIRSFEKLTGGGMTFLGTDVIRVLEEVLPQRFGGAATDYQLLEEETDGGHALLRLVVGPRVGEIDPQAVAQTFLHSLGSGSMADRIMETMLREGGFLRAERRAPVTTSAGKVLHLHLMRRPEPG